jgi:CRISPR-associated protein (TIGR02584 family)
LPFVHGARKRRQSLPFPRSFLRRHAQRPPAAGSVPAPHSRRRHRPVAADRHRDPLRARRRPSASAFVPTEIHLITTRSGAEKARLALLSEEPGWFHRLSRDYALPPIRFTADTIHVLEDAGGRPLDDIRSPEDNRRAADGITALIREFTADPDCALHVSIAGGRKTMGFFLGYALSLYGRPQDKLSHVLVSEPFESSLGFYYPTPSSRVLEMPGGRLVDSAKRAGDARRTALRQPAPRPARSAAHRARELQRNRRSRPPRARPAELQIDLAARRVRAAGKAFSLPPAELALLSVFARRALRGEAPLPAPAKELPDADWKLRYLVELRWIAGPMKDLDETERALRLGMDGGYFSAHLSKLKKILRRELGPAAEPYLISDGGSRPRRYSLGLRPSAVNYVHVQVPEQHAATLNNILSGA